MNTAEKYIYEVYTQESFSKAAKSLFVSQPSLSAVVARKEEELGFRIFDRSTKPVSLTAEGQIYLNMLEEMVQIEREMHLRIMRLTENQSKSLSIGANLTSLYYMIPAICGAYYRRYPEMEMVLDMGDLSAKTSKIERISHFQKLERGDLDAVFCYEYDTARHCVEHIYSERMIVAMREEFVTNSLRPYVLTRDEVLSGKLPSQKEISVKGAFLGVPFFYFSEKGNTGRYMSELVGEYTQTHHRIEHSRNSLVHFNMMCVGVGALLTSDIIVAHSNVDTNGVVFFAFDKERSIRNIYLATRKGVAISQNLGNFITVAKEFG